MRVQKKPKSFAYRFNCGLVYKRYLTARDLCITTLIPIFFIIINQLLISYPKRTIYKVFESQILVKFHSCESSAINNKPRRHYIHEKCNVKVFAWQPLQKEILSTAHIPNSSITY